MSEVSGDAFGPIAVDYFNGRRVEDVRDGDGAEGSPFWTIELEGEGLIHNYDPSIPKPTTITGAALTRTILSHEATRLQFGLEEVQLNPIEYAMVDPTYTDGLIVYPQRSDYNMPLEVPDDPSQHRVKDGPAEQPEEVDESE